MITYVKLLTYALYLFFTPSTQTLVAAVTACGLVDTLKGDRFTIFAPSDEAFAKLPEGTVEALLADIPKLTSILTLHVVPGTLGGKKVPKNFTSLLIQKRLISFSLTHDHLFPISLSIGDWSLRRNHPNSQRRGFSY